MDHAHLLPSGTPHRRMEFRCSALQHDGFSDFLLCDTYETPPRADFPILSCADLPASASIKSIGQDEVNESAYRHTSGVFGEPWLGVVIPRSGGGVRVNPRCVSRKFLH